MHGSGLPRKLEYFFMICGIFLILVSLWTSEIFVRNDPAGLEAHAGNADRDHGMDYNDTTISVPRITKYSMLLDGVGRLESRTTSQNQSCSPKNKYVFVKTHKTGGSTLANVLHRRTWARGLRPVIPKNLINMGWPLPITPGQVLGSASHTFNTTGDVLVGHLTFNAQSYRATQQLVPNAAYISILRDPLSRFLSAFKYYGIAPHLSRILRKRRASSGFASSLKTFPVRDVAAAVEQFAQRPLEYLSLAKPLGHATGALTLHHALLYNSMAFDLGLIADLNQATAAGSADSFSAALAALDTRLSLVLLNEYWDESMVLLKRRMCWTLDDVVYRPLKAPTAPEPRGANSVGTNVLARLPPATRAALRRLLHLDYALYAHFNATFWRHVANEGPGFHAEVGELRARVSRMYRACGSGAGAGVPAATPLREASLRGTAGAGRAQGGAATGNPSAPTVDVSTVCVQLGWENVRFGCELGKRHSVLPAAQPCLDCAFDCKGKRSTNQTRQRPDVLRSDITGEYSI
eukprot:m.1271254 g.1271254  ORF g.1271254 m.1271254 type:complete len:520 (+) comp24750_c0_seq22:282-1841(+)